MAYRSLMSLPLAALALADPTSSRHAEQRYNPKSNRDTTGKAKQKAKRKAAKASRKRNRR